MTRADDIAFARELNRKTVASTSTAWPTINRLHREGLVKIRPISRFVAEVIAIGEAELKP